MDPQLHYTYCGNIFLTVDGSHVIQASTVAPPSQAQEGSNQVAPKRANFISEDRFYVVHPLPEGGGTCPSA